MGTNLALAAIAPLLLLPMEPGSVDLTTTSSVPVGIAIEDASPAWTRRVEWGLARFQDAGLPLPPIVVSVHEDDDKGPCNGNSGLFRPADPAEVHLCVTSAVDSAVAKRTTLHELAHAWAETKLTATEQASFVALRGLEKWADQEASRHDWGAEHAAEVVSWGLMDEAIPIIRIDDAAPAQLLVAFDELVGRAPLWDDG